jgi:DNA-binding IclR family transcriptional regulator
MARTRSDLQRLLGEIKAQGYATATRTRRLVEEISISVPVLADDRVLAALTVRFAGSAVPLKTGLERFLPKLRQCAAKISSLFSEQQADARLKSAPETAA